MMDMDFLENRHPQKVEPFRYLWRLDDKEWLSERKAQWRHLASHGFSDIGAKEKKLYKDYFVLAKKNGYIPGSSLLIMTPFDSPESASDVFWSKLLDSSMRKSALSSFFLYVSKDGVGIPWLRQHVQHFVTGVLGTEYRTILDEVRKGSAEDITPDASFWARKFMVWAEKIMKGEFDEFHAYLECTDYFVSALAHADDPEERSRERFNQLWVLVEKTLDNPESNPYALEMAQKLKARESAIRDNWSLNAHLDEER